MSTNAKIDLVFSALADATRRDILMMLLEDDMAVTDVAEPFDMSLAAISKHLDDPDQGGADFTGKARAREMVQIGT
jgi:DNA-binding transcriptional ArsR family regulator